MAVTKRGFCPRFLFAALSRAACESHSRQRPTSRSPRSRPAPRRRPPEYIERRQTGLSSSSTAWPSDRNRHQKKRYPRHRASFHEQRLQVRSVDGIGQTEEAAPVEHEDLWREITRLAPPRRRVTTKVAVRSLTLSVQRVVIRQADCCYKQSAVNAGIRVVGG